MSGGSPGARRQLLPSRLAPVPSREIRSRLSRRWRRPARPLLADGTGAPGRARPRRSRYPPSHLPRGRATTSALRLAPTTRADLRDRRPRRRRRVCRTVAAARGPQTREQRHAGTGAIRPSSRSSSSASPPAGPPPRASPISPSTSTTRAATSSPSPEQTSTRCRSPASAWAGTPMTARPTTTPPRAGKIAVSLFRELTDNLYVFGQLTTSISDEGDAEPATETEIDNLLVSFTPAGRVEPQPHLRHARRSGRLRARRRGAALHPVYLLQLRAGPAGQAHRPVRRPGP